MDTLVSAGIADSNSSARRLVEQGAVKINNTVVNSPKDVSDPKVGDIIQAGRKAVKIIK